MEDTKVQKTIEQVTTQLHKFVTEQFLMASDDADLKDDDLLFESGIIDSAGAITLVSYLEKIFNIRISDDELFPENFATVDKIAEFVVRKEVNTNGTQEKESKSL